MAHEAAKPPTRACPTVGRHDVLQRQSTTSHRGFSEALAILPRSQARSSSSRFTSSRAREEAGPVPQSTRRSVWVAGGASFARGPCRSKRLHRTFARAVACVRSSNLAGKCRNRTYQSPCEDLSGFEDRADHQIRTLPCSTQVICRPRWSVLGDRCRKNAAILFANCSSMLSANGDSAR